MSGKLRLRVLLLGDSIAFGSGLPYKKTLGPLLEQKLNKATTGSFGLWNAAVPGYNSVQELAQLRRVLPVVRPTMVLVAFCMNDYLDPPRLTSGGQLDATAYYDSAPASFSKLLAQSRAYVFLKEKAKDLQKIRPELFPPWMHYVHYIDRKPGWQRAKAALLSMHSSAHAAGIPLVLIIFPLEEQIRLDDHGAQDDLAQFAREHDIPIVDLFGSFREHWREHLYVDYWREVGTIDKLHPNSRGHELAAEQIARFLANANPPLLGAVHNK